MESLVSFLISERFVMTVILANTLAMTASGFHEDGTAAKRFFDGADYLCVLFFVLEASLKIWRQGWSGYRSSGWNRFDFLVTVLCLPVLLEPFTPEARYLAWLPVFRAGRLFRLLRLLRFIPDSTGLAQGIGRALKASVGVFLALALVNLIFALAASFLFGDIAPEHFGDPGRALYTMFQIFTLEGWNQYPESIEARLAEREVVDDGWIYGSRIFFSIAVLVGGVLGFSLANAVFIDEMTLDNNRALEAKIDSLSLEIAELRSLLSRHPEPTARSESRPLASEHREP